MRVLKLTSPFMKGEDVKKVQRYLKLLADGEYGPATGSAVAAWKYRMGFPKPNTGMGIEAQQIMFRGKKPLRPDYVVRRLARMKAGFKPGWGIPKPPPYNPADAVTTMEGWANQRLTESPPNSNVVPQLVKLAKSLKVGWAANMGYPWCAFAASLAGLVHGSKTAQAGLVEGKFNALYTVDVLAKAQAAQFGMTIVGRSQARRGDIGLLNFSGGDPRVDHEVRLREAPATDFVKTAEGNTSGGPGGSQSNGGGCFLRERPLSDFAAFVRDS